MKQVIYNHESYTIMIKSVKTISVLLLFLVITACQKNKLSGPERVPDQENLDKFDKLASVITKDLAMEAYSYAIVTNQSVIRLVDQGIEPGRQVPAEGLSMLFLSAILLQFTENNVIDINDHLSKFGISGNAGKAQVKNLLSYTLDVSDQPINYNPENEMLLCKVLESATKKDISHLFRSGFGRNLKMKETIATKEGNSIKFYTSLNDLILFSQAIDRRELFQNDYTADVMFRPVYLVTGERSPCGLGCFIDLTDDRKLIWLAGRDQNYPALFFKSVTDSLSLIFVGKKSAANTHFIPENDKVTDFVLYHAFAKTLLPGDSSGISVDFHDSYPVIRQSVQKMIESGKRDQVYEEMCAYLRMYTSMSSDEQYDSLAAIYNQFFPKDIPPDRLSRRPLAEISKAMDYVQLSRTFTLQTDTMINIYATAEYTKEMTLSPWEYDNIEVFFDLKHERGTGFNSGDDDRQYRFNYDFPTITGNAPTYERIILAQKDVSSNRTDFEIALPWRTLYNTDSLHPALNQHVGFDIAIADNDSVARQGSLAWNSVLNDSPWASTGSYGTMILVDSPGQVNDTICYAVKSNKTFETDGLNKGEWDGIPRYPIDNEFMAGITGPEDQSGWFRARWDNEYLYLFVEIKDDVKRLLEKTGDYGWILNAEQDTVWMLTEDITLPAGGDKTNRYFTAAIPLKAGNYTLRYQTNQTHSYGRWTKGRPELSSYGIVLWYK